jgi:gp32 DNA binding protein like
MDAKKSSAFKKMMERTRQIRQEAEENSGRFERVDWFIPQKGDNSIRILPGRKTEEDFFRQVSTHFMPVRKKDGTMAKIPVRCLRDFDQDCPICRGFARMVKSEDAKTKDDANWLRPSTKFLVNVINYQERKVQPYAMALSVFNSITGWMEELGTPIFDLEQGRDFKVVKKTKGGRTEYEVRPSMSDSAVPEKLRPLLEGAMDLEDLYKDNERERMEEYIATLSFGDDEAEEEEAPRVTKKKQIEEEDEIVPRVAKKKHEIEEDETDDEDEELDLPKAKFKSKAKDAPKKSKKPVDDEDDFGDLDDEDLDKEFDSLNV